jgi:hypothetical protein
VDVREEAAKVWVFTHAIGRRNLSETQKAVIEVQTDIYSKIINYISDPNRNVEAVPDRDTNTIAIESVDLYIFTI